MSESGIDSVFWLLASDRLFWSLVCDSDSLLVFTVMSGVIIVL